MRHEIIRRSILPIICVTLATSLSHLNALAQKVPVRIAAAADLQYAMSDLAPKYEKQTGNKLEVSYGSSGNLFSQLENGAPFDLFFSADIEYPKKLQVAGFGEPDTLFEYAIGRIVIWLPPTSKVAIGTQQWNALLDPAIQKIAIANPEHAPYGRAAVAAMREAGIYEKIHTKLVFGENIAQAAQFVQSGNAQAGIVALSLALSPAMKDGQRWEIPDDEYPPIEQDAILMKKARNKDAARGFLDFVRSAAGRATFAEYGFGTPLGVSQKK